MKTVSGGIAECAQDEGVRVEVFDFDNYLEDKENTQKVPALFADLAAESSAPVEDIAGLSVRYPDKNNFQKYYGSIVAEGTNYVVQTQGRGIGLIHIKGDLDKVPEAGEKVAIQYRDGRGQVSVREHETGREVSR